MTRLRQVELVLVIVTVAVLAFGAVLITFWQFEGSNIYYETGQTIVFDPSDKTEPPVVKSHWKAGETIAIRRQFCVTKNVSGVIRRTLISNGFGTAEGVIHLPITASPIALRRGCGVQTFWVQLPFDIAPGRYIYRVRIEFDLNPLREIHIEPADVTFWISGNDLLDKVDEMLRRLNRLEQRQR